MSKDTAGEREEREWRKLEKKLDAQTETCDGTTECKIRRWFGSWFTYRDKK